VIRRCLSRSRYFVLCVDYFAASVTHQDQGHVEIETKAVDMILFFPYSPGFAVSSRESVRKHRGPGLYSFVPAHSNASDLLVVCFYLDPCPLLADPENLRFHAASNIMEHYTSYGFTQPLAGSRRGRQRNCESLDETAANRILWMRQPLYWFTAPAKFHAKSF